MSREVRMVPANWEHPKDYKGHYLPLYDAKDIEGDAREGYDISNLMYMPKWTPEEATHLMMYESISEGTPISPAFSTAEELARWLTDNNANRFCGQTASYEEWLGMIRQRWVPSAVC